MFDVSETDACLGAVIRDIDLSGSLDSDTIDRIQTLWLQRKVLVFRDQQLSPDQQLAFTRLFGELDQYPFLDSIEGYPDIAPVLKLPQDKTNFGGVWHSDTAYLDTPAKGATLYALELPPVGGDTLFADMAAVYAALPADIKRRLIGRKALNRSDKAAVSQTRESGNGKANDGLQRRVYSSVHPVIRTHPQTAEPVLYVNAAHTEVIEGMAQQESDRLLASVCAGCQESRFQFRVRWEPGTLVLWDNRCTQHFPLNDYPGHRRLLHRVSIKGDRPV